MSTETENRQKMRDHASSLLQRAASTDPDDALTSESPLSLEVSGKYVNVLFSTGGPHTEMTAEYEDADSAEYWYEVSPVGAWFTYMDWGVREDMWLGAGHTELLMVAIMRDPENLTGEEDDD